MSIKLKFALLTSLWLVGILVAVNVNVYFAFLSITTDNETDWFSNRADLLMNKSSYSDFFEVGKSDLLQSFLPDNGLIRVVDTWGKAVKTFTNDEQLNDIQPKLVFSKQVELATGSTEPTLIIREPILENNRVIGTVEMMEQLEMLNENISTLILILVLSSLGALALCFVGGIIMARWLVKPVTDLVHTMEGIEQSLEFRKINIKEGTKDELHALVVSFNRMIDRIENSFARQRQFVADASHEFKTPLTVIEGYAEMLLRWGLKDEKHGREAAESIYSEAARMQKMTNQLLELASSEQMTPNKSTLDMVSICKECVNQFQQLYQRDIQLVSEHSSINFEADPLHIKQLLVILLDNAIKYSSDSILVKLSLRKSDSALQGVELRVKDKGIGIPEHERSLVFERFYRIDRSRVRKTGGTGLGLSIARNLVQMYKGTIEIVSAEGAGTEVLVYLPFLADTLDEYSS